MRAGMAEPHWAVTGPHWEQDGALCPKIGFKFIATLSSATSANVCSFDGHGASYYLHISYQLHIVPSIPCVPKKGVISCALSKDSMIYSSLSKA